MLACHQSSPFFSDSDSKACSSLPIYQHYKQHYYP
ncbi:unnamed protein product [Brassica rapa subsp. trilocularis]